MIVLSAPATKISALFALSLDVYQHSLCHGFQPEHGLRTRLPCSPLQMFTDQIPLGEVVFATYL